MLMECDNCANALSRISLDSAPQRHDWYGSYSHAPSRSCETHTSTGGLNPQHVQYLSAQGLQEAAKAFDLRNA